MLLWLKIKSKMTVSAALSIQVRISYIITERSYATFKASVSFFFSSHVSVGVHSNSIEFTDKNLLGGNVMNLLKNIHFLPLSNA